MALMGINGGLEEIMSLAGMTGNIYGVNELSYLVSFRRNGRNAEWPGGRNGGYDDRNGRYDDRNGRRHGAVYEWNDDRNGNEWFVILLDIVY